MNLDLTTRENLIASLPKGGIVAEIGVDYGYFSEKILALCEPKQLYLIDCWENQSVEVYGNDPANNTTEFKNSQFQIVVGKFKDNDNVIVKMGYSAIVANTFSDDMFDWVYIDANHLQARQDIEAWLPKVKGGGFILGHDYTMVGDFITVKKDVDDYVSEHGIELFVTTGEGGDIYEKNYPTWIFKKNMSNGVIIFVADNNYVDHVKSIAVNCVEQGKWGGDFVIISPTDSFAANEFKRLGFEVLETTLTGFMQKFEIFNEYFKKWDKALYLDCDIIIQDDLQRLMALLDKGDMWMDTEDGNVIDMFWRDEQKEQNKSIYQWMEDNFPDLHSQTFNSSCIVFNTHILKSEWVGQLTELQNKIRAINDPEKMGTDQQPINLLLWKEIKKIPNKLICFWGLAEPVNDVASEWRGWVGGEVPVAIHYTRWYAQWLVKTPNADAYFCRKLNMPCRELYEINYSKFNTVFNKC